MLSGLHGYPLGNLANKTRKIVTTVRHPLSISSLQHQRYLRRINHLQDAMPILRLPQSCDTVTAATIRTQGKGLALGARVNIQC